MKKKVFISTTSFGEYSNEPLELLSSDGYEYALNPLKRKLSEQEIIGFINEKRATGLIAGTEVLNCNVLASAATLKVISRCGTGLDNVDLAAADELGIRVYNTPDAPTKAVAEMTLGLLLDCLRKISLADREIRQGKWVKPMGELLCGKTIGIIGYGRIGRAVAGLAQVFGTKVMVYDIALVHTDDPCVKMSSFEELIKNADIVTLHIPVDKSGKPLIHSQVISKMKSGAYVINASRGGLVDEKALYEALKSGKLAGAGLDTFGQEPYVGKLVELPNVVLTSHIGSYAKQSRIEMELQAVRNLIEGMR